MLKIKPLRDDEVFDKLVSAVQYAIDTDGYHWSFWKTGGGWGEVLRRYKPYKKKEGECLSNVLPRVYLIRYIVMVSLV